MYNIPRRLDRKLAKKYRKDISKKVHSLIASFQDPDNSEATILLVIFEDEHECPHFHVCRNNKHNTIACLRLDSNEYYDHRKSRTAELSKNILEKIDNVFNGDSPIWSKEQNLYSYTIKVWNDLNAWDVDKEKWINELVLNNMEQPKYINTRRI